MGPSGLAEVVQHYTWTSTVTFLLSQLHPPTHTMLGSTRPGHTYNVCVRHKWTHIHSNFAPDGGLMRIFRLPVGHHCHFDHCRQYVKLNVRQTIRRAIHELVDTI